MSKIGQFIETIQEFTVAAQGLNEQEVEGLSFIYFSDDFERRYALQHYNPQKYNLIEDE